MGELNQYIKSIIEQITFLSRDVLHVYGGVLFFMFWVIIFKQKKLLICLLIIYIGAIFNEILDISFYLKKTNSINWMESITDVFNTIFLPTLLLFFLKYLNKFRNV